MVWLEAKRGNKWGERRRKRSVILRKTKDESESEGKPVWRGLRYRKVEGEGVSLERTDLARPVEIRVLPTEVLEEKTKKVGLLISKEWMERVEMRARTGRRRPWRRMEKDGIAMVMEWDPLVCQREGVLNWVFGNGATFMPTKPSILRSGWVQIETRPARVRAYIYDFYQNYIIQ